MQIAIIILIKRPEDNDNETKEWVEKKSPTINAHTKTRHYKCIIS